MKSKYASYLLILLALTLLFPSCLNRPREVLSRRAMEQLMFDIYIAEATMSNDFQHFNTPEKQEAFIRQVLRQHRVTPEQWYASLNWYSDRIDQFLQMNDSVMNRLRQQQEIVNAEIARRVARQQYYDRIFVDSHIPRFYSFSFPSTRGGLSFRLNADNIAEKVPYEEFSFDFGVIGIPPTGIPDFRAILTLEYSDTTVFVLKNITENRMHSIPIQRYIERDSIQFAADSIQFDTLRQLHAFVRLPDIHRVFTNVQLYNISLGAEPEEETLYYLEADEPKPKKGWLRRTWRSIWNRQNNVEAGEENEYEYEYEYSDGADSFFDIPLYYQYEEDN